MMAQASLLVRFQDMVLTLEPVVGVGRRGFEMMAVVRLDGEALYRCYLGIKAVVMSS